ncbi:helix-turn-helix domain-containing protein [Puteibacter caeruleilacunae]|nr:helix-turn-helix domain-containing protein [Puteibacter caeruleilacunae]
MKIGLQIKELRVKKGMTQEELADKTEVSTRTIQRIENGKVDPRAYTLQMIAKALEVDYSMFVKSESADSENQDDNNTNWLLLLHLTAIIPLIFPTVIFWNRKGDCVGEFSEHYHNIVAFQLKVLGALVIALWIYWLKNEPIPFIGVLLVNALFTIVSAVKVVIKKQSGQLDELQD